MRTTIFWVTMMVATLAACGAPAEPPTAATLPGEEVVATTDGAPSEDPPGRDESIPGTETIPPPEFPSCRPVSQAEKAPLPWKAGDVGASGWKITEAKRENPEFVQVKLEHADAGVMTLEIKYNAGEPGEWATESYQLMPGQGLEAPEDLLKEQMTLLRDWNNTSGHTPFVEKREGVLDKYAGLPNCEE